MKNKVVKGIASLVALGSLYLGCAEIRKDPAEETWADFKRLEQTVSRNPEGFESLIEDMFDTSYELRLLANKDNNVREGYVDPKDIRLKYNRTQRGNYFSIIDQRTGEELELFDISGIAQIGTYKQRLAILLEETKDRAYAKAWEVDRKVEQFCEEHDHTLRLLETLAEVLK